MSRCASSSERQLFESDCTVLKGARCFVTGVFSFATGVRDLVKGRVKFHPFRAGA